MGTKMPGQEVCGSHPCLCPKIKDQDTRCPGGGWRECGRDPGPSLPPDSQVCSEENGGGGRTILTWTHLYDCFIHAVSRKGCQSWTSLNPRRLFAWPQGCGHPAYGSSMSKNSCLGGAAPRYHAQEPSLLLMQAKNLAWCPLMFFSVTQSIQRHSSGEEM